MSGDYCDPRLQDFRIETWTDVEISQDLAATMLSLFLEMDHPTLGVFDADLFLDDLVNEEMSFCSPLLVNALLFYTSVRNGLERCLFDYR